MKLTLDKDAIIAAIVRYAGPLDDPGIGWRGGNASHPDLFRCERCGSEHTNCDLIPHKEDCSAAELLRALANIKKWMEETK